MENGKAQTKQVLLRTSPPSCHCNQVHLLYFLASAQKTQDARLFIIVMVSDTVEAIICSILTLEFV